MQTDANGMPVLEKDVDDAKTSTFNTAFAMIGTTMTGRIGAMVPDLDALVSITGTDGQRRHVDELNADFEWQDTKWVQVSDAIVANATDRDTAYNRAGGAFKVNGARVRRLDMRWTEDFFPSTMLVSPWNVAGFYPIQGPGLPLVRAARVAQVGIVNATFVAVSYDQRTFCTVNSMFTANTTKFFAPVTGLYDFDLTCSSNGAGSGTNQQHIILRKNGTDIPGSSTGSLLSGDTPIAARDIVPLLAGDYVECFYYQASGITRNTGVNAWGTSGARAKYIGPVLAGV